MQTLIDHPLDKATTLTVDTFMERVATVFEVRGAILFGSRARGEFSNDSDADIAVLMAGQAQRFMDTKLAMSDIAFDILLETGIRVEALPIWENEWNDPNAYRNPTLLRNIERDGIVIR